MIILSWMVRRCDYGKFASQSDEWPGRKQVSVPQEGETESERFRWAQGYFLRR